MRNGGSLPLRRERRWCADYYDRIEGEARKFRRKLVISLRLTEHEPVFDCKILTFDVAKVAKPAEQCLLKVVVGGRGEITQTRRLQSLLLRASGKRPCGQPTDYGNKLPPPHVPSSPRREHPIGSALLLGGVTWSRLGRVPMSAMGQKRTSRWSAPLMVDNFRRRF
jgi:hypothetical protein